MFDRHLLVVYCKLFLWRHLLPSIVRSEQVFTWVQISISRQIFHCKFKHIQEIDFKTSIIQFFQLLYDF